MLAETNNDSDSIDSLHIEKESLDEEESNDTIEEEEVDLSHSENEDED